MNQRRWLWSAALGGVVLLILYWWISTQDASTQVTTVRAVQALKADHANTSQQADPAPARSRMALGDLSLFRSKSWAPPAPPPPKVAAQPIQPTQEVRAVPVAPSAPPLPYAYMGVYDNLKGGVTVYMTKAGRVYGIKVGDVLESAYRLDAIEGGQLVFTYVPLGLTVTVPAPDLK